MRSTDQVTLEYAQGTFVFNFDPAIGQGGILKYKLIESDLPIELRPTASGVSGSQLRSGPNTWIPGSSYIISNIYPGTKIARVQLTTTATSFSAYNTVPNMNAMNLRWKNVHQNFFTQIFANVNGSLTDITDSTVVSVYPNYYGMFIWMTIPWDGCNGRPFNFYAAPEGLYNSSLNRLNRRDTVVVEFHHRDPPFTLMSSFKSRLDSLNISTFTIGTLPSFLDGDVYVVIKHHNSIETWSKTKISFNRGGAVSTVRFLDSASSAYGNNLNLIGSKYFLYSGDVNQDRSIDVTDVIMIYNDSQNNGTGYLNSDLNGDNYVNLEDLLIAYNNAASFVSAKTPQ
jgi:hypothetical protein